MMTDEADTPDEVVAAVVAEISGHGKLKPLTDEQQAAREIDSQIWHLQRQSRIEQENIERQRKRAIAAERVQRERAVVAEQEREKRRRELSEQHERMSREREIADLRFQTRRQAIWQHNVETAARNAVAIQQRQALLTEMDAIVNPRQPQEPEVTTVYIGEDEGSPHLGDPNFNPDLWKRI